MALKLAATIIALGAGSTFAVVKSHTQSHTQDHSVHVQEHKHSKAMHDSVVAHLGQAGHDSVMAHLGHISHDSLMQHMSRADHDSLMATMRHDSTHVGIHKALHETLMSHHRALMAHKDTSRR